MRNSYLAARWRGNFRAARAVWLGTVAASVNCSNLSSIYGARELGTSEPSSPAHDGSSQLRPTGSIVQKAQSGLVRIDVRGGCLWRGHGCGFDRRRCDDRQLLRRPPWRPRYRNRGTSGDDARPPTPRLSSSGGFCPIRFRWRFARSDRNARRSAVLAAARHLPSTYPGLGRLRLKCATAIGATSLQVVQGDPALDFIFAGTHARVLLAVDFKLIFDFHNASAHGMPRRRGMCAAPERAHPRRGGNRGNRQLFDFIRLFALFPCCPTGTGEQSQ
jgi:hypothetical protein